MAELRIYGASDDLVEFEGAITDEFGAFNAHTDNSWFGELHHANGEALRVHAGYVGETWFVGVAQVDEATPIPPWPLRVEQGQGERGDPLHAAIGRWLDAAATELEWVQKHNDRQAERAARLGGTDGHTYVMAHALVAPAIDVADAYLGGGVMPRMTIKATFDGITVDDDE